MATTRLAAAVSGCLYRWHAAAHARWLCRASTICARAVAGGCKIAEQCAGGLCGRVLLGHGQAMAGLSEASSVAAADAE